MRSLNRSLSECLVCSRRRFSTFLEGTFSGSARDAAPFFLANRRGVAHGRIVSCQDCGFRFTNPQFLPDDYEEIYRNVPGPEDIGIALEQGDARRFQRLAKYVRRDVAGGGGRFLDFGCGRGGFLAAMGDPAGLGFEVGEPGTFRAGPSQVVTGRLFDVAGHPPFEGNSFDFITAFDVFEHLPDLDRYVEVLAGLLRPGGHLVITVPNVESWNARLSGARWNMYLLEHLWYFDRRTLRAFMERAGFQQIRLRSLPYDAPLAHIVRRVAQTYGVRPPPLGAALSGVVLPVPIGLMYAVYQWTGPDSSRRRAADAGSTGLAAACHAPEDREHEVAALEPGGMAASSTSVVRPSNATVAASSGADRPSFGIMAKLGIAGRVRRRSTST